MKVNMPSFLFKYFLPLVVGWLLAFPARAQDTVFYNLGSPYHTINTHLQNLQADSYHPQVAGKTFNQEHISPEEATNLAIKLKQIWDGEGMVIAVDRMPQESNYIDTLAGQSIYVISNKHPEIFLKKVDRRWLYASSSYLAIEQIHDSIYPFGADLLVNLLPRGVGNNRYFGLKLWQYLGIVIFLILGYGFYRIFTTAIDKFLIRLARRLGYTEVVEKFVEPVARPLSLLLLFVFWLIFLPMLQFPVTVSKYLVMALKAVMPFFGVMIFYALVDVLSLYFQKLALRTSSTMDDQLIPIIRRSMKVFVVIVGMLFILHNLDVNITALLAGLSIGGLALALAAQETLKNFFGSIMIFLDRPFQIGDWISSDGIDGTVEEVGFRSTRIRTFRNSVTSVPNGRLADQTIDNHGLRMYRRFNTHIAVTYDTPANVISTFVEGLKKIVAEHPHTRKDYYEIHLHEMGSSSLNILFYIFFKVPSWTEELTCRHQVLLEILKLAEALEVRFAFPTQTLHMETFPGKLSLTPESFQDMKTLREKLDDYFNAKSKNLKRT
jgi:MscS family membrane protein